MVAVGMLSKRAIFFRIMSIYGDMMGKTFTIYDSMVFFPINGI